MQAKKLVSTTGLGRNEWLECRRKGIGGSDAAVILGLSKYKTPFALYLDKTGEINQEEEQSEPAYWGTTLEEVVAQEFSKRTGLRVRRKNEILQHPEHSWMLANVDRLIVGEKTGLECKTASAYLAKEWEGEQIPASYIIQCQHYMAVTGFDAWWIAVLVGGNQFVYKKIMRDDELIDFIVQAEKGFWENHVLSEIPPEIDGSEAGTELLKSMYPESNGQTIDLLSDADTYIEALQQIDLEIKELEGKKNEYQNKLKEMLGEAEKGATSKHTVIWKSYERSNFDSKSLQAEHPDLYKKYSKKSLCRKFSIK